MVLQRCLHVFCLSATLITASGCGEDNDGDRTRSDGELGPGAQVRLANVSAGETFDVWAASSHNEPVRVAEGIAPGTISS